MRRPLKEKDKHIPTPDHRYNSEKVTKFINYTMRDGKKSTAQGILYRAFDIIKEKAGKDPLEVFDEALRNVGPALEVRSRRVGGANYQVPYEVRPERKLALAIRWIHAATESHHGKPMEERLAEELMAAAQGEGDAIKKKENTLAQAEANKAFAHFAFVGSRKKKKK